MLAWQMFLFWNLGFSPHFCFCPTEGATDSGIVNGKNSKAHSRPYMVSLQVGCHHTCGGILIGKSIVLTAAHCKKWDEPTDEQHLNLTNLTDMCPLFSFVSDGMTAVLGAHNISKSERQQRIDVAKLIPHPNYTSTKKFDYDIMLLKVNTDEHLKTVLLTVSQNCLFSARACG